MLNECQFYRIISTLNISKLAGPFMTLPAGSKKSVKIRGADVSLSRLMKDLSMYKDMAWAKSTVKALNSRQKAFLDFCLLYDRVPIPADPNTLSLFAVWLVASERIKSANSIPQYLSSVRTLHRANNSDCVTPKSSPELEFALAGISRHLSKPPRRMSPITPQLLQHLLSFPPTDHHSSSWHSRTTLGIIRHLYIIMFYSMLRISNLVPNTASEFDPRRQLTWDRVKLFPDGAVLEVVLSKTIQRASRVHEVALAEVPDSPFCPVRALKELAELRGECHPREPVFVVPNYGGWSPLTRYHVDTVLTMQIEAAGLDTKKYKFHSFRRGAIQLAIRLEPKIHLIRLQSDHSSAAFECYTSLPPETRFDLSQKMIDSTTVLNN